MQWLNSSKVKVISSNKETSSVDIYLPALSPLNCIPHSSDIHIRVEFPFSLSRSRFRNDRTLIVGCVMHYFWLFLFGIIILHKYR